MSASHAPAPQIQARPQPARLESLDALRGFDMLWISGAGGLGGALAQLDGGGTSRFLSAQLHHVAWTGLHFWDLIFPLFIFVVGTSATFSLGRLVEKHGRAAAAARLCRRSLLLFAMGVLINGGLSTPFDQVRWMGVLQRIALCYLFAGLLFVFLRPRSLVVVCAALLAGYWVLLTFAPVPGFGAGDYAEGHNLTNWIDKRWLPGHQYNGDHDPEGILSTLPAIASCLLGVFAGLILCDPARAEKQKAAHLAIMAAGLLAIGYAWSLQVPIIKKIWTPSFVFVTGGWSTLLLTVFYLTVDVWKYRTWTRPFIWIGTNALTIYIVCNLLDLRRISERFVGGSIMAWLDARWAGSGGLLVVFVTLALCLALCRFLYQRKIFLRL